MLWGSYRGIRGPSSGLLTAIHLVNNHKKYVQHSHFSPQLPNTFAFSFEVNWPVYCPIFWTYQWWRSKSRREGPTSRLWWPGNSWGCRYTTNKQSLSRLWRFPLPPCRWGCRAGPGSYGGNIPLLAKWTQIWLNFREMCMEWCTRDLMVLWV